MTRSGVRERGSTVVEAALTLSLFLTIVFGVFDFAWVLFQQQTYAHQARTAVRWAVVNLDDTAGAAAPSGTLLSEIQSLAACGQLSNCPTGTPVQPGQVTVSRPDIGTTQDRIVVTIPQTSYVALVGARLLGGGQTLSLSSITVSLPIENTTPIPNL